MIIDLPNDKAKVFDGEIDLESTTSGHYCINILPDFNFDEKTEIVLILENELPNDKKRDQMMKIHKQFGHATADNILKLLNNANIHTSDISLLVKEVARSCSTCKKFRKPSPRPVVGFSKADDFNQTVSVDLHELKSNLWYLHIVDEFTPYSAATLVNNKSLCAKAFIKTWISIFGAPQKIFGDNGGEFIGDKFHDMCEWFNIKIQTSPSYSPWSIGLCERHNQTLTATLLKVKEDTKCDFDTALAWAVCAKNSLINNNNGFSPSQLVFGRNTNLPNFISKKLPAQETTCKSFDTGLHISALHAARKAFIETESSSKLKLALKNNLRPATGTVFSVGDEVYYKRDDSHEWKGPGKVLGHDRPVVFIRKGSRYIKAHTCRVQPASTNIINDDTPKVDPTNTQKRSESSTQTYPISTSSNSTPIQQQSRTPICKNTYYDDSDSENDIPDVNKDSTENNYHSEKHFTLKIKPNSTTSFVKDDNIEYVANVLNRGGKATSKYANYYNTQYKHPEHLNGTVECIDTSKLKNLKVSTKEPQTVNVYENNCIDFNEARLKELHSWLKNYAYQVVPKPSKKCISLRWVITMKETESGIIPKARLVARGFEEDCLEKCEKESPTCSKDTLRTIFSLIAYKNWQLKAIDIKTAFLQGDLLNRDVYIIPPPELECPPNNVWKLNKCVYGRLMHLSNGIRELNLS